MSIASLPPSRPDSLPILAIHGREDQHMVAEKHETWMKVCRSTHAISFRLKRSRTYCALAMFV